MFCPSISTISYNPIFRKIRLLFILIFSLISIHLNAQTQIIDSTKVDSLTFTETRNKINLLPNDIFEKHVFTKNEKQLPYRLLLPNNYDKTKDYPLIIAFQNSSRIGNDNEKQLEHLSKIWIREEIYNNYQAYVIVPQFNERSSIYEKDTDGRLTSKPFSDIQLVLDLLHYFQRTYQVDKNRIYLIGYSMGASTAQHVLSIAPHEFAAIVSVAPVPDFSRLASLKKKNILLIHGKKDINNPYSGSEELFYILKGNNQLIFKTYTELNHDNITIPLLLGNEIPEWLFKQQK